MLPLKHVGDVRGMGLFWGIELVADKEAKTPFKYEENVNGKLADEILARGVAVYHGAGCVSGLVLSRFRRLLTPGGRLGGRPHHDLPTVHDH